MKVVVRILVSLVTAASLGAACESSAPASPPDAAGFAPDITVVQEDPGDQPLRGLSAVKTMQGGDIFAMAKRGGAYNTRGAVGWEWLELKQLATGLAIVWRGIAPPAGACYGAIVGGACNDCHSGAPNNDYVLTPALQLGAH
jgi:hypothetical protein